MDPTRIYSTKTEKYARYRWDYAPQAVEASFTIAGLSSSSMIVDVGASSGIMTRHFIGRVGRLVAVEPGLEMRRLLRAGFPSCLVAAACAETRPLPNHCADLITVAQAIHWFKPQLARAEFRRVLKPGGWLALFRNYSTDREREKDFAGLYREEYGVDTALSATISSPIPVSYYFDGPYQTMTFPFSFLQDWEAFLGALLSAAAMPVENHPHYPRLEAAARKVFERYCTSGLLTVHGETELIIGKMAK